MFETAVATSLPEWVVDARKEAFVPQTNDRLILAQTTICQLVVELWRSLEGRHQYNLQRLQALGSRTSFMYSVHGDKSIEHFPDTLPDVETTSVLYDIQYTADLGLLVHRVFMHLRAGPNRLNSLFDMGLPTPREGSIDDYDFRELLKVMNICRPFMDKEYTEEKQIRGFLLGGLHVVVYSSYFRDHKPVSDQNRLAHQFGLPSNWADAKAYEKLLHWDLMMSRRRITVDETRAKYLAQHKLQMEFHDQSVLQPIAQPVIQPAAQAPVRRRRDFDEFERGQNVPQFADDEALAAPLLPPPNKRQRNLVSQPPRPVELAPPVVHGITVNYLDDIDQGNTGILNGDGAVPLTFGNFDNFVAFDTNGALPPAAENFDFGGTPQGLDSHPELDIWANGPVGDNMNIVNFDNLGNFDFNVDFAFEGVPDLPQPGDMDFDNFGNLDGNGTLPPNARDFDFDFAFEGVPDLPQPGDMDFANFGNLNDTGAQPLIAENFDFELGIEGIPEFPHAANAEDSPAFEAEFDALGFDADAAYQWLEAYEYGDQPAEGLHVDPVQQPQQWADFPLPVPAAAAPEVVWDIDVDLGFLHED